MTGAINKSNKFHHPEQSEGTQAEQIIVTYGFAVFKLEPKFANEFSSTVGKFLKITRGKL